MRHSQILCHVAELAVAIVTCSLPLAGQERRDSAAVDSQNPQAANSTGSPEPLQELTPAAQAALEELRGRLADESEARIMLEDIVKGSELGPTDGWFRVALAVSAGSETRAGLRRIGNFAQACVSP